MKNDEIEALLIAKLRWAWEDGCPVAGSKKEYHVRTASLARRRWFSYERRRPEKVPDTRPNRVEDLARYLCSFEKGGLKMAGPLIEDYRWLANQIADVFLSFDRDET